MSSTSKQDSWKPFASKMHMLEHHRKPESFGPQVWIRPSSDDSLVPEALNPDIDELKLIPWPSNWINQAMIRKWQEVLKEMLWSRHSHQASLLAALDQMGKCRLVDLSKGEAVEEIPDVTRCDSMWLDVTRCDLLNCQVIHETLSLDKSDVSERLGKNQQLDVAPHHYPSLPMQWRPCRLCARSKRRCGTCGLTSLKPRRIQALRKFKEHISWSCSGMVGYF